MLSPQGVFTMTITLDKRVQSVGIRLNKRGITKVKPTRVGAIMDVSGSAYSLYQNGVMQETFDRLLAVAKTFDDDGSLDSWAFDHGAYSLPTITEADEGTYVARHILNNSTIKWGTTNYAPPLRQAIAKYFPNLAIASTVAAPTPAPSGFLGRLFGGSKAPVDTPTLANVTPADPAMILFITDGSNSDRAETAQLLRAASKVPVYFNMVGVGDPRHFTFIEEMADELPNVGFVPMNDLSISDDQLYDLVLNEEFCNWVKSV